MGREQLMQTGSCDAGAWCEGGWRGEARAATARGQQGHGGLVPWERDALRAKESTADWS